MLVIPTNSYTNFSEEVVIENQLLRFAFSWNSRGEFWSVTISDRDQNIVIAGVKLVMGLELLGRFPGIDLPTGKWFCIHETNSMGKITREDLGSSVQLIFVSEEELASL